MPTQRSLLPLILFCLAAPAQADVFASSGSPLTIPTPGIVTGGLEILEPLPLSDVDVLVALDHPRAQDLGLTLIAPGGKRVELLSPGSLSGGVRLLCFDDEAGGVSPQGPVASLAPIAPLSRLDGKLASGRWKLEVVDTNQPAAGQLLNFALAVNGQVRLGSQVGVVIGDFDTVDLPLSVPDDFPVGDLELGFWIDHTFPGDLTLRLTSPDGVDSLLFQEGTLSLATVRSVVLDDDSDDSIQALAAGGSGRFRTLSGTALDALTGAPAAGTWELTVNDDAFGDIGVLEWWWLHFVDTGIETTLPSPTAWADPDLTPALPRLDPCDVLRLEGSDPAFDTAIAV
ncbi:MAG: proprotein convertase P-domain-containing protein, partial [Planctomycetota bacterium]